MQIYKNKMIENFTADLKSFNLFLSKSGLQKDNVILKEENLNISAILLENERISMVEYKYDENSYIEAKINQIQLLRETWLKYMQIESSTLFDFMKNTEI
jgi:hypothetical protein